MDGQCPPSIFSSVNWLQGKCVHFRSPAASLAGFRLIRACIGRRVEPQLQRPDALSFLLVWQRRWMHSTFKASRVREASRPCMVSYQGRCPEEANGNMTQHIISPPKACSQRHALQATDTCLVAMLIKLVCRTHSRSRQPAHRRWMPGRAPRRAAAASGATAAHPRLARRGAPGAAGPRCPARALSCVQPL